MIVLGLLDWCCFDRTACSYGGKSRISIKNNSKDSGGIRFNKTSCTVGSFTNQEPYSTAVAAHTPLY